MIPCLEFNFWLWRENLCAEFIISFGKLKVTYCNGIAISNNILLSTEIPTINLLKIARVSNSPSIFHVIEWK